MQRKRTVPLKYGSYGAVDGVIFINVFVWVNRQSWRLLSSEVVYSVIEGTPVIYRMKWLTKTLKTASFLDRDLNCARSVCNAAASPLL